MKKPALTPLFLVLPLTLLAISEAVLDIKEEQQAASQVVATIPHAPSSTGRATRTTEPTSDTHESPIAV